MSVTVTLVGAAEFQRKVSQLGGQLPAFIRAAVEQGANVVRNEAVTLAPIRTGTLRRSITVEVEQAGNRVVAMVGPQEPYGKYIEFGTGVFAEGGGGRGTPWRYQAGDGSWVTTRGSKPQPFLRPAFDTKRDEAEQEIRDTFTALVEGSLR